MSEHLRTVNGVGAIFQWYDAERVMILDSVTGEPQRFGRPLRNSIGTLDDALEYIQAAGRIWETRLVIVRLNCIVGAKVHIP